MVATAGCQADQRSTSVCSSQILSSGASINASVRYRIFALPSMPRPPQVNPAGAAAVVVSGAATSALSLAEHAASATAASGIKTGRSGGCANGT
ncbi:hypothetical protein AB0H76_15570 [Nocardia sp. NPDC050712]|uniref:hypothetical protein n=1 Tax=Nocardia sp. NPDC050712 TaxID=3155518 RepID=UPI0033D57C94